MKMKKYNTEIKVESVSDKDYPIVISYHFGCGMSPWGPTIEDARALFATRGTPVNWFTHQNLFVLTYRTHSTSYLCLLLRAHRLY